LPREEDAVIWIILNHYVYGVIEKLRIIFFIVGEIMNKQFEIKTEFLSDHDAIPAERWEQLLSALAAGRPIDDEGFSDSDPEPFI